MTIKFQVGETYAGRSICDHDCVFEFTILARTAKQVTVIVDGKTVRRGLSIHNDVEFFRPFGNYSMATSIYANRRVKMEAV